MTSAFLALWNDYPSVKTEEYEAWHTFEHVPERLTTPGMRGARRYAAMAEPENQYFTLYELEDLGTIEQPAYFDLVKNPTDWSARMRLSFSNVLRIPATTVAAGGRGTGCCSLVLAYSLDRAQARTACTRLEERLNAMVSGGVILSFLIGLAEPNQPYEVFVQDTQTDDDTYNAVVIIDGASREMLEAARASIQAAADELLQPRKVLRDELFDLIVAYPADKTSTGRGSVAASAQLRQRFGF
jgi:hypothetical protein